MPLYDHICRNTILYLQLYWPKIQLVYTKYEWIRLKDNFICSKYFCFYHIMTDSSKNTLKKHHKNCKTLPWEHQIGGQMCQIALSKSKTKQKINSCDSSDSSEKNHATSQLKTFLSTFDIRCDVLRAAFFNSRNVFVTTATTVSQCQNSFTQKIYSKNFTQMISHEKFHSKYFSQTLSVKEISIKKLH